MGKNNEVNIDDLVRGLMAEDDSASEADANKSWEGMRQILDREMPEDKDRNRTGFFLLFGVLVLGGLLTWGGMKVFRKGGGDNARIASQHNAGSGTSTYSGKSGSGTGQSAANGHAADDVPMISATTGAPVNPASASGAAGNGTEGAAQNGSIAATETGHANAGHQTGTQGRNAAQQVNIGVSQTATDGSQHNQTATNPAAAGQQGALNGNTADGNQVYASGNQNGNKNTAANTALATNAGNDNSNKAGNTNNKGTQKGQSPAAASATAGQGNSQQAENGLTDGLSNSSSSNKNNTASANTSTPGKMVTLPVSIMDRLNGKSYTITNDTIVCCTGNTRLVIVNVPEYLKGPALASTKQEKTSKSSVGLNKVPQPQDEPLSVSARKGLDADQPSNTGKEGMNVKLPKDNGGVSGKSSGSGYAGTVGRGNVDKGGMKKELYFKLPFQIGVSGGVYTSIIPAQPNWGWMGGLNVVVPFDERWSMMMDVRYMQHYTNKFNITDYALQKVRVDQTIISNQTVYGTAYDSLSLINHVKSYSSLQVPIAVQHMVGKMLLYAGINLNWVINSQLESEMKSFRLYRTDTLATGQPFTEMSNTNSSFKASSLSHRLGVGYTFGMSYYVAPGVYMDVRLTQGLTDKKDQFSGQTAPYFKAPFLQFSVGYRLGSPIRDLRK